MTSISRGTGISRQVPVVRNFSKDNKGGPFIQGAGLYVWLYRHKQVEGDKTVFIFRVEKGIMGEGRFVQTSTHDFKKQPPAMDLFHESRRTIQKLVRMGKDLSSWPDLVL